MQPLSLLVRLGLSRPELRAWAMYDWANSRIPVDRHHGGVPAVLQRAMRPRALSPTAATARFAWATTIAVAIVAIIGPVLGALADYRAWKKRLLAVFVAIGVAATLLFATIGRGDWMYAAVLFIVANIGVATSLVFYDSLLPHIAAEDEMDRVSTAGYAIGFIGGGILLLVNLAWILSPDDVRHPRHRRGDQAVVRQRRDLVAGLLHSAAATRARAAGGPRSGRDAHHDSAIRVAFARIGETFHEIRSYRNAFLMLVAFLLYNDGIGTIIRMASIYGTELGIDRNAQIAAFVMVQFVGVPCAFLFGALADRHRRQAGAVWRARRLHRHQHARLLHDRPYGTSSCWRSSSRSCRAAARR